VQLLISSKRGEIKMLELKNSEKCGGFQIPPIEKGLLLCFPDIEGALLFVYDPLYRKAILNWAKGISYTARNSSPFFSPFLAQKTLKGQEGKNMRWVCGRRKTSQLLCPCCGKPIELLIGSGDSDKGILVHKKEESKQ